MDPKNVPDLPHLRNKANINDDYDHQIGLLSEVELRQLSKDLHSLFAAVASSSEGDRIGNIENLLPATLRTAYAAGISSNHRAAACNALCGFLEQGLVSTNPQICSLIVSKDVWQKTFQVYLDRSEDAKPKSMRQVLVTLIDALNKWSAPDQAMIVKDSAIETLLSVILRNDSRIKVRPALQALEHFIRKGIVVIQDVVIAVQEFSTTQGKVPSGEIALQSMEAIPTAMDEGDDTVVSMAVLAASWEASIEAFVANLLEWLSYSDVAPAASHLISTFFRCLRAQSSKDVRYYHRVTKLPLWVSPFKQNVKENPDGLEVLKHHVLPGIFLLDSHDLLHFIHNLPFEHFLSGAFPEEDYPEVPLLFSSLQVAQGLGFVRVTNQDHLDDILDDTDAILVPLMACGQLLTHSSAVVRVASLDFLVSSVSTTKPFPPQVLSLVLENLAPFHADTDSRVRNEVLDIIRSIVQRLRGATSRLDRDLSISRSRPEHKKFYLGDKTAQFSNTMLNSEQLMDQHIAFLTSYIRFLGLELLPTASYQRHITALKALAILLQSGLDSTVPPAYLSKLTRGDVKWPFNLNIKQPLLHRMLIDLSMDPFDDVRNAAVLLLKMTASTLGQLQSVWMANSLRQSSTLRFQTSSAKQKDSEAHHQNQHECAVSGFVAIMSRAQKIMHSTGRADHADGVARLYEVLDEVCNAGTTTVQKSSGTVGVWWSSRLSIVDHILSDLEQGLLIAKDNLRLAVAGFPIHGHIAALRYIISRSHPQASLETENEGNASCWKVLHDRILACCDVLWESVRDVLCMDSPEGHTVEDVEDDVDIGEKDTLSFSWRALKESSSLLHAMLVNKTYSPRASAEGLQYEDYDRIGRLSFTQLAELRHRGAFSTVSQTFAACCMRCAQSSEEAVRDLIVDWYKDTLNCIQDRASKTTRRSAGIPALVGGILAARPEEMISIAFIDLQAIAKLPVEPASGFQDISLPQVHALNCLKNLYFNTKLGAYSENYVSEGLDLAASCLESKTWAIQNCGLMLFRALIDRLFGTNDRQDQTGSQTHIRTSRLSYEKYPSLPRLLVMLLGGDSRNASRQNGNGEISTSAPAEFVFPALEIIRRAGPPPEESVTISALVMQHLGSNIWNIRVMAARTYCSLVIDRDFLDSVAILLDVDGYTSNRLHGILLSVKFLGERYLSFEGGRWQDDLEYLVSILGSCFEDIVVHNKCPITKAAYLDIVNLLMFTALKTRDRRIVEIVIDELDRLTPDEPLCQKLSRVQDHARGKFYPRDSSHLPDEESLWRRSVGGALALYYVASSRFHDLSIFLRPLSYTDPDTACAIFEPLASLIVSQGFAHESSFLFQDIIHIGVRTDVQSAAIKAYLCLIDRTLSIEEREYTEMSQTSESVLTPLVTWTSRRMLGNPTKIDLDLRVRGYHLLAICRNTATFPEEVKNKLWCWSRMLRLAGDEQSDFSTRYAAVSSLSTFKTILRPVGGKPNTSMVLLDVYLALYDTLNDDDEEVRDLGAEVVSWIVSTSPLHYPSQSLVSLAASLRFSRFLAEVYSESSLLFIRAVQRFVGLPESHEHLSASIEGDSSVTNLKFQPVHDLLISARTEDTALFAEEKQNLFIDEVREAQIWSGVLTMLSNYAYDAAIAAEVSTWVIEGIRTLIETAKSETDGALGWTSKPEVFTLGTRVIYGASVLLHWEKLGLVHGCGALVLEALEALKEAGRKSELHEMWIDRIEHMLSWMTGRVVS